MTATNNEFDIVGRPDDINHEIAKLVTDQITNKNKTKEVPDYALLAKSKVLGVVRIADIPLDQIN